MLLPPERSHEDVRFANIRLCPVFQAELRKSLQSGYLPTNSYQLAFKSSAQVRAAFLASRLSVPTMMTTALVPTLTTSSRPLCTSGGHLS